MRFFIPESDRSCPVSPALPAAGPVQHEPCLQRGCGSSAGAARPGELPCAHGGGHRPMGWPKPLEGRGAGTHRGAGFRITRIMRYLRGSTKPRGFPPPPFFFPLISFIFPFPFPSLLFPSPYFFPICFLFVSFLFLRVSQVLPLGPAAAEAARPTPATKHWSWRRNFISTAT